MEGPQKEFRLIPATADALRRQLDNHSIIWVGAGASIAAGYPSTDQIVGLMKRGSDDLIQSDDFTEVADKLVASRGLGALRMLPQEAFGSPRAPTEFHYKLAALAGCAKIRTIVTTNYDDLIERALATEGVPYKVQTFETNFDGVEASTIHLLKIHGSFQDWENIVFSSASYKRFQQRYRLLTKQLSVLCVQYPLTFVGSSLCEPRILSWLAGLTPNQKRKMLPWRAMLTREEWERLFDYTWNGQPARDILGPHFRPLILATHDEIPCLWSELAKNTGVHSGIPVTEARVPELTCSERTVAADNQRLPQKLAPEIPIVGRDEPLQQLLHAARESKVRVASLIGPAGIGKTSLIQEFLGRTRDRNGKPLGLEPFIWHFLSKESSLTFFERALRFYGFSGDPAKLSHRELSNALVTQLRREERYLIVLDGVETLQGFRSEPEEVLGDFLQSVCRFAPKPGALVLATSRQPLVELGSWTASGEYLETTLEPLDEEAGIKLLRRWLKIKGDVDELRSATRDMAGNPACLVLLGKYLEEFHNSQIYQRGSLKVPAFGGSAKWANAVIEWYDKSLEKDERAFLKLLALFGRPMHENDLGALMQAKAKSAQPLQDLTESELNSVYTRLSQRFLLGGRHTPGQEWKEWETHALLRTYYADQFRNQESAEWREAHQILFKYYASQTRTPTNREELLPLYGSISHACLAGDYLDALQVYRYKIARNWEGFDTETVGAGSETLLALSAFFKGGSYRQLCGELLGYDRGWLLARVAYCLESLGDLRRAVEPREASNQAFRELYEKSAAGSYEMFERARDVAYGVEELAASQIRLGKLVAAERTARTATEWADRTAESEASCREKHLWPHDANAEQVPSWLRQCSAKSMLGSVLYRCGRLNDAQIEFKNAYALHQRQSIHSDRWPLHSEPGVRFCMLKLEMARTTQEIEETLAYAEAMLDWSSQSKSPHATDTIAALHSLVKSLALLALGRDLGDAERLQTNALQWIRNSKKLQFLCDLLLGRAAVRRLLGHQNDAYCDLQEILELSKTCGMRLAGADANLLAAHLSLDDGNHEKASNAMKDAREMILPANQADHYRLRRAEFELLEARYAHYTRAGRKVINQHLNNAFVSFSQIGQWRLEDQWQRYFDGEWIPGRGHVQRARV